MSDTHRTLCSEAEALVYGDRQQSYGHPHDNAVMIAALWRARFGWDVGPEDVGPAMRLVKEARQSFCVKRDNLRDIAGYAEYEDRVRQRIAEIAAPKGCPNADKHAKVLVLEGPSYQRRECGCITHVEGGAE